LAQIFIYGSIDRSMTDGLSFLFCTVVLSKYFMYEELRNLNVIRPEFLEESKCKRPEFFRVQAACIKNDERILHLIFISLSSI
jgi:hypothetical protein